MTAGVRRSVPTWRMRAVELAREFAAHYGWTVRAGGWIYDGRGRPVAQGWDTLAGKLAGRGWIIEGVGINWRGAGERPALPRPSRSASGTWR